MEVPVLTVKTDTDNFTLRGRPCELSAYSFIPVQRNDPPERTVFNTPNKKKPTGFIYDRLFKKEVGFNNKLHRDDREHAKLRGLTVNDEEKQKEIPTRASSDCGHRLDMHVDHPDRKYVRIAHVKSEFYRRNGITS